MKNYEKKIRFISLLVGVSIFVFLIYKFGVSNIIANIQKTGWSILLVFAVWGVVYFLNSLSLYLILGKQRRAIKIIFLYFITLGGSALNIVTPLGNMGGEPYRVMELSKYFSTSFAVSKIILYKMMQWLSHFLLWTFAILIIVFTVELNSKFKIILLSIFAVLILLIFLLIKNHKNGFIEPLFNKITKFKFIEKRIRSKRQKFVEADSFIKELYNDRPGIFFSVLMTELLARLMASIEFLIILKSIGININFFEAIYVYAIITLIANLFFFMPYAMGVKEGGLYLIMENFMAQSGIGIYVALINRIREFFWIFIGLILVQLNSKIFGGKSLKEINELKKL